MKRLLAVTGVILVAYILLSGYLLPRGGASDTSAAGQETVVVYTVREYRGRVAVYRDGGLTRQTDTAVASLPKSDRVRLQNGIDVYSEKELKALMEDLCS